MELRGLVGGIQKFSTEDGPGIRTTVFLKGCPLRCMWCHNPELIEMENQLMYSSNRCILCGECMKRCPTGSISFSGGVYARDVQSCTRCFRCVEACYSEGLRTAAKSMSVEEVMKLVEQDRSFYAHTGGGMTISGGECLVQYEFVNALTDAAAGRGIGTALDTSGFAKYEELLNLARKADIILYDLKSMDDDIHKKVTGVSNKLILSNLIALAQDSSIRPKIFMRMPLAADVNDSDENIDAACALFTQNNLTEVTLLPYHELGIVKYKNLGWEPHTFYPPSDERMDIIRKKFITAGIRAEVLGKQFQ